MTSAMEILRQDHKNLERLLEALERQVAHFEAGEETDLDIVKAVVDYCLTYPDLCHHPKEDVVLRQLQVRDAARAERVGDLEDEHRRLAVTTRQFGEALDELLKSDTPLDRAFADEARRFLDDYRTHMEMEETHFFPVAEAALTPEDWQVVDREVEQMVDPMFGGRVEERYKVLRNEILLWDEVSP